MRLLLFLLGITALFTFCLAWEKEDYEIFDLVTAVENSEGKGTTFYSWLGVTEKATHTEITKAYRKKSLELHPDKNRGVKGANERYARLGVVAEILRGEGRERYDFWMKRGVPKWRGSGYYFNRFRPGLGTVLIFLTLLTALLQNMVHRMTYKTDLQRVRRFMLLARKAAWGPKLQRSEVARKVKVRIDGNPDIEGEEQEYIPGRTLEMLVQGDEVFLLENGERHPINEDTPLKPNLSRTWPFALASWVIGLIRNRGGDSPLTNDEHGNEATASSSSTSDEEEEKATKATGSSAKQPGAAVKAGGARRRKGNRR